MVLLDYLPSFYLAGMQLCGLVVVDAHEEHVARVFCYLRRALPTLYLMYLPIMVLFEGRRRDKPASLSAKIRNCRQTICVFARNFWGRGGRSGVEARSSFLAFGLTYAIFTLVFYFPTAILVSQSSFLGEK